MANRIVVDPITRIEGHLRIEAEVKDGKIADAWSSGTMVRGFEIILKGRDPRDAWAFTERACGVCTTVHALASCRTVEDALGVAVPPNAELIRYVEAWERKIHFNTPIETVRDVARRLQGNPVVTVAVRSDGSVESVTFVRSSGVAEVDEAVRSIVQSHEHYQAFSPALAREVDVIEIRRTWHFDTAVRLY